jgi:hypothetical protein
VFVNANGDAACMRAVDGSMWWLFTGVSCAFCFASDSFQMQLLGIILNQWLLIEARLDKVLALYIIVLSAV